ncbi:uncharacterized protein [Physcomitrium patens]|uniref:uncharacterized protein isoform X2 n=1 Tax=Physcomitrium patens TaxID=3218 RepID=UPI003CCCAFA7
MLFWVGRELQIWLRICFRVNVSQIPDSERTRTRGPKSLVRINLRKVYRKQHTAPCGSDEAWLRWGFPEEWIPRLQLCSSNARDMKFLECICGIGTLAMRQGVVTAQLIRIMKTRNEFANILKFAMGLTPNPDLDCNQHIKFDALLENALQMGADKFATGHYARLSRPQCGGPVQLLRGIDEDKDQSYFLASVGSAAFERVLFPLGGLTKAQVRDLALSEGLVTATKRSSAGICFVGRRKFRDFISEYVEMEPGPFVCVDGNTHLGLHTGIAAYTHGQRAGISGVPKPFYVVGKDVQNNVVYVAMGADHPALFCTSAVAGDPFWISGSPPKQLQDGQPLTCMFKARYRQSLERCTVCFLDSKNEVAVSQSMGVAGKHTSEFRSSDFCRPPHTLEEGTGLLQIRFEEPTRAITPGQALVLYDGDVCLGASVIAYPGPSLFEHNQLQEELIQASVNI